MPVIKGLEWTFDTKAELYEKMRPGYSDKLYREIFRFCPLNQASSALEIGIGAGQATEPVLKSGCKVTSVERGAHFTDICNKKFSSYPHFTCINSRFEDFDAQENSFDLIYAASSFHWIDEEFGYRKVHSLLKKGGAFARFANHPYKDKENEAMEDAIQKVYARYMPDSKMSDEYTMEAAVNRAKIAEKYGFCDIEAHIFRRVRTFTAEEYTDLLGTYSDHIAIEENTRMKFFSEIRDVINSYGGVKRIFDTMDLALARKI